MCDEDVPWKLYACRRLTVDLEDLGLLCGVKTLVGDLKEAVSKFDMKAEGARGFLLQFVRTLSKAAGGRGKRGRRGIDEQRKRELFVSCFSFFVIGA